MSACYPTLANTEYRQNVPGCDGTPVPEDPSKLQGPELGYAVYHDKYAERDGRPADVAVRVIARSYVWAPEEHHDQTKVTGAHGYRNYDWSVIERGPGGYRAVVVSDTDLRPLAQSEYAVIVPGERAYALARGEDYGR